MTLQLKRSLGGYSHRERCRAPDRIQEKVKVRARSRRHFKPTKEVKDISQEVKNTPRHHKESKTSRTEEVEDIPDRRSRRQCTTRIENTVHRKTSITAWIHQSTKIQLYLDGRQLLLQEGITQGITTFTCVPMRITQLWYKGITTDKGKKKARGGCQ